MMMFWRKHREILSHRNPFCSNVVVWNDAWGDKEDIIMHVDFLVNLLKEIGCVEVIFRISLGYWRKAIVYGKNKGGDKVVLKISKDSYSRQLLLNEVEGVEFMQSGVHIAQRMYNVLSPKIDYDNGKDIVLLVYPWVTMRSCTYWSGRGRCWSMQWLNSIDRDLIESEHMLSFPSHGDFVYWNVFQRNNGQHVLIDFEYFSLKRPLFFDEWHWICFPLVKRSITIWRYPFRRYPHVLYKIVILLWKRIFAGHFSYVFDEQRQDLLDKSLLLYLRMYCDILMKEVAIPRSRYLIGSVAYNLREEIIDVYKVLERYLLCRVS